jgi:hypothetical protein
MDKPSSITPDECQELFALGRACERADLALAQARLALAARMGDLRERYHVGAGWRLDGEGQWLPPAPAQGPR